MGLLDFLFGSKDDKRKGSKADEEPRFEDYYEQMKREEPWKYYGIKRDTDRYLDERDKR